MKIGVSSAVLYPEVSENAIAELVKSGFDTFEFFYNCEEEISQSFIKKVDAIRGDAEIISIHPYTAFAENVLLFSDYKRRTEESIEKYKRVFETASKLGIKFFTLHGERLSGGFKAYGTELSDRSAETLSRLSSTAKQNGITLCLENVSWCKSSSVDYIRAVSDRVRDIGFTLDLKQARRAGVNYCEYIDAMGSKIKNIHVSDYDDNHDCILPGKGKFDFQKFKAEIEEIGYNGDVIIEVYSECFSRVSEIADAKCFLEENFV